MQNLKALALTGAIGLLLLAVLVLFRPKMAPPIQPENVSEESVKGARPAAKLSSLAPPGEAPRTAAIQITKRFLSEESARMNRIDSNPRATQEKLMLAALKATPSQITLLRQTVMDPNAGENERALALYLLTLNPHTPTEEYFRIASLSEEPSGSEFHDRLVSILAVAGLEQIQNRALKNPSLVADIVRLSERSKDRSVREMAKEMLAALQKGRLITAEVR